MCYAKCIKKFRVNFAVLLNILCMAGLFAAGWFGFYRHKMEVPFATAGNIVFVALVAVVYVLCFFLYGTMKFYVTRSSEIIYDQVLSLMITDFVAYVMIVLLCRRFETVYPLLLVLLAQVLTAILWTMIVNRWYFSVNKPDRTVIIWDVRQDFHELYDAYKLEKRYSVVRKIRVEQCIDDLSAALDGVDAVFLSGVHSSDRNKIIKYCVMNNIDAYVIPRVGDTIMSSAKQLHLSSLPVMKVERYCPTMTFLALKRLGDILISGLALVILSPLMIVVGIIIKATDGGTVFYKQVRLTKDGRPFYVLKFRSMRMDAEKDGVARLSTGAADDRITPIGRFIRAVRIDELPQLINIIKGDMAIVGPRPERPEIEAEYEENMPEFRLRLQAKAGLTGYAQVHGRYNTTPYDKLLMDLTYIANPSLLEDIKICFATIKILFMPESTEGVAVGQINALKMDAEE